MLRWIHSVRRTLCVCVGITRAFVSIIRSRSRPTFSYSISITNPQQLPPRRVADMRETINLFIDRGHDLLVASISTRITIFIIVMFSVINNLLLVIIVIAIPSAILHSCCTAILHTYDVHFIRVYNIYVTQRVCVCYYNDNQHYIIHHNILIISYCTFYLAINN